MTSTRLFYFAHNAIPAPFGPRRPSWTRNQTSPLPRGYNNTTVVPADKIEDVLRDPGYYCEVYPDTLPLTRRLYQQIRGRSAPVLAAEDLAPYSIGASSSNARSNVQGYEPLDTEGDAVVLPAHRGELEGKHKIPPIGSEIRASSFWEERTACVFSGELSFGHSSMLTYQQFSEARSWSSETEVANRATTTMDILERGEWAPQEDMMRVDLPEAKVEEPSIIAADMYLALSFETAVFTGIAAL